MKFTKQEKEQILSWYNHISEDKMHYGNGKVMFPQEVMLLNKLKSDTDDDFTEYETDLIKDWMDSTIKLKYGDSKYLFGIEFDLYKKLK